MIPGTAAPHKRTGSEGFAAGQMMQVFEKLPEGLQPPRPFAVRSGFDGAAVRLWARRLYVQALGLAAYCSAAAKKATKSGCALLGREINSG